MKAIHTKYSGPTNSRGARIIVTAEGCKRRSIPYNYGASDPHVDAARTYATELGWTGDYVRGTLPDGSVAHTPVSPGLGGNVYTVG